MVSPRPSGESTVPELHGSTVLLLAAAHLLLSREGLSHDAAGEAPAVFHPEVRQRHPTTHWKKKAHFISLFAFTLVFLFFYLFFFFEMLTELHKPKLSSPTQPRRTCSTLRIRPVDVPRGLSRCGQLPQPNYILFRLGHWRPHRLVANLAALMHPDHRLFISLTHSVTQTQAHTHPGIHQQHRVDNFGRDAIQFVAVWVIFLPFHFVKLIKKFGFWI